MFVRDIGSFTTGGKPEVHNKYLSFILDSMTPNFRDAHHRMPIGNRLYQFLTKPFAKLHHPLLLAGGKRSGSLTR